MKKRNRTQAYIKGLHTQIRGLKSTLRDVESLNQDNLRKQSDTIIYLQKQIEKTKEDARGSLIVNWRSHSYCQSIDGLSLANLKAGDQVAIIGWVTDTKTWLDKDEFGKPCSRANIDIRETRKVSGFLAG